MNNGLEPGFYWIQYVGDTWSAPVVAERVGLDWFTSRTGMVAIADQFAVKVLSGRLVPPASKQEQLAERIVAEVERRVTAEPMEGDNAVLEYDRKALLAAIVEVLKS